MIMIRIMILILILIMIMILIMILIMIMIIIMSGNIQYNCITLLWNQEIVTSLLPYGCCELQHIIQLLGCSSS